jgi:hypothetical protein
MAVVERDATYSLRVRYEGVHLAGQGGAASPIIQNANLNAKLALMEGRKTRLADLKREAQNLLSEYRKDPQKLQPADLLAIMENSSHGRGSGNTTSHNVRGELCFLLSAQSKLSIPMLCEIVGISTSTLFKLRRRDAEVDQLVKDYQASFFEDEAMTQEAGIHPALVIFGLKARAGWMDAKESAITYEQMAAIAERFINIVREELKGEPNGELIIDRIHDRLTGDPLRAHVESVTSK